MISLRTDDAVNFTGWVFNSRTVLNSFGNQKGVLHLLFVMS